jgi:exodeoxyribonuclease V beta subunit
MTFPLNGARLIEASAGTGKTYTIAALYLRLILGHGGSNAFRRPLTPPEILVVTFTNAATEELRDRIRLRLTEAAACFRGQEDGDEYLIQLRSEYEKRDWRANARLLEQAAQWMDEAAIHTIHAWCQRVLLQHAFDSGSLFDLTLETDETPLLEEAACDYWRRCYYPLSMDNLCMLQEVMICHHPCQVLEAVSPLLQEILSNVGSSSNPVSAHSKKAGIIPCDDLVHLFGERRTMLEKVRRTWVTDFDRIVSLLRKALESKTLNKTKYGRFLERGIEQLNDWLCNEGPMPKPDVLYKFSTAGLAVGVNKHKTPPIHPAFDVLEAWLTHLSESNRRIKTHAAENIGYQVWREKVRRAQFGFDDLLIRLYEALHDPVHAHLGSVVREQFPVAMIDEFQDTDPVQYAAFRKIYLDTNECSQGTLLMIGDPKQAIYAFRGADIHTYLNARQHIGHAAYTLEKNYRSVQGIVNAVNQMFCYGKRHPGGTFLFKGQIDFEPVAANDRQERFVVAGQPVTSMNLWLLDENKPVNKNGRNGYLDRMAQATAAEIVRLLNLAGKQPPQAGFRQTDGSMEPLRPADIAILVRNKTEAAVVRRVLQKRNVCSVYLSDQQSVFDTDEARELCRLLQACAEPENPTCLRTALAGTIPGLTLKELDDLQHDEWAWETYVVRFQEYRIIWLRRGVLPMLRVLLRSFKVPSRLLQVAGGERILTNLLHLTELLQTASVDLDGPQALIRWLIRQCRYPAGEMDEQIVRLESDADLVRVVTFHKSKGLEYPLVFLPFVCACRPVSKRDRTLFCHDAQGRKKTVLAPGPDDIKTADTERLAEDLRLLYVAVTRAIHACWMGIGVINRSPLHQSAIGCLLNGGSKITNDTLPALVNAMKGSCDDIIITRLPDAGDDSACSVCSNSSVLLPARSFQGNIPRDGWISSYSSLVADARWPTETFFTRSVTADIPNSPDSAMEEQLLETDVSSAAALDAPFEDKQVPAFRRRTIHTFPRGPEAGTFLHNLLEWAAGEGFKTLLQYPERLETKVHLYCARRGWKEWAVLVTKWLQQCLEMPLVLPWKEGPVALGDMPCEDFQAEMEFLFSARQVKTAVLDNWIHDTILKGKERPRLRKDHLNGMLKGFMDLVFMYKGRYYVLDYKSNWLGDSDAAYHWQNMQTTMLEHRYDLQFVLYTLALHRLLNARLPDYHYDDDFGGVCYWFLRGIHAPGNGLYVDKPPFELVDGLDAYFRRGPDENSCWNSEGVDI